MRDTTLLVDEIATLTAVARDGAGQPASNPVITWSSSLPGTVTVDNAGRVQAIGVGSAVLTATWNGIEARATVAVSPQFVRLAPGAMHTCGISGRGDVYCWGAGADGNLGATVEGVPDCSERFGPGFYCTAVPVRLANLKAVGITTGGLHTCVVDAAGVALCWGANHYGQTGNGTPTSGPTPTPTPVAGGHRFVQLAAGRMHTCGITTNADAYCWGLDHAGQLGAGDVSADRCVYFRNDPCSRVPRLVVGGHKWAQLAASEKATCGLTTDGNMYCWGLEVGASDGRYCQLPDNFVGCTRVPLRIASAKRSRAIGLGDVHFCEQAIDGTLECWGANYWGMFGNGTVARSTTPVPAGGGAQYVSFVAYRVGACALAAGEARCWGNGADGQIGNGIMPQALVPVPIAGNYRFTALESNASADVVCGLADTGRAYCWGRGIFGQLGNGAFLVSGVPAQVQLIRPPARSLVQTKRQ